MKNIVGVRFKNMGKVYYFDAAGHTLAKGQHVIVETSRGIECGEVAMANRDMADEEVLQPLRPVVRPATEEDVKRAAENAAR